MSEIKALSSVSYNTDENEFCINLEGGQKAYIRYKLFDEQSEKTAVDFYTTYVPNEYRSKGLAAILVAAALAWAEQHSFKVLASCSYVALKLNRRRNR